MSTVNILESKDKQKLSAYRWFAGITNLVQFPKARLRVSSMANLAMSLQCYDEYAHTGDTKMFDLADTYLLESIKPTNVPNY